MVIVIIIRHCIFFANFNSKKEADWHYIIGNRTDVYIILQNNVLI